MYLPAADYIPLSTGKKTPIHMGVAICAYELVVHFLLHPNAHKVYLDGQGITLTHKEYGLLAFLMANPRQIFNREQLLNRVWGYDFEGTTRAVDTHIKPLRQKLGDESKHIVTLNYLCFPSSNIFK